MRLPSKRVPALLRTLGGIAMSPPPCSCPLTPAVPPSPCPDPCSPAPRLTGEPI